MTGDAKDLFSRAVYAWQADPYDPEVFDELLIAIVTLGWSDAVDLARAHLPTQDVDSRATAYQLLAVAAQLGDEDLRGAVAELVLSGCTNEHDPEVLVASSEPWALRRTCAAYRC